MPTTLVFQPSSGYISSNGQVLQGRGVEDHLGAVLGEDLAHTLLVADAGHDELVALQQRPALDRELDRLQARTRRDRASPVRRGARLWSWRHSSEPIEPPAPVTSTRRPVR